MTHDSENAPAVKLTPGEDLVMEVLAARYRLGERIWTFDKGQARWINGLADKGLVSPMHGIVENTVRAALTDAGREYYWPGEAVLPGQLGQSHRLTRVVPRKWLKGKKTRRRVAELVHGETR